jgi:hypothetical protein
MVCFICDKPASAMCEACHRYVCAQHTSSGTICANCSSGVDNYLRRLSEEQERSRHCDFCHTRVEDYLTPLPKCGICKRQFCEKHGQVRWYSWSSEETLSWYRCQDHMRGYPGKERAWFRPKGPPDHTWTRD